MKCRPLQSPGSLSVRAMSMYACMVPLYTLAQPVPITCMRILTTSVGWATLTDTTPVVSPDSIRIRTPGDWLLS